MHLSVVPKHSTLLEFEVATNLGPVDASRLLGVAYVTYAQYRRESRVLPPYHLQHIEALLGLSEANLQLLIRKYTNARQ